MSAFRPGFIPVIVPGWRFFRPGKAFRPGAFEMRRWDKVFLHCLEPGKHFINGNERLEGSHLYNYELQVEPGVQAPSHLFLFDHHVFQQPLQVLARDIGGRGPELLNFVFGQVYRYSGRSVPRIGYFCDQQVAEMGHHHSVELLHIEAGVIAVINDLQAGPGIPSQDGVGDFLYKLPVGKPQDFLY